MQDAIGEIDIGAIKAERFARTQACASQQSYQRRQGQCTLRIARRNATGCRNEYFEFVVAQDAWRRNGAGSGKLATVERLGSSVVDGKILAKTADDPIMDGATVGSPFP